jgi:GT2 family glycosyltransferase
MEKKKKFPLVSIIIPAYNVKSYVLRCVRGVFSARYPNIEVFVVDNGSADGSVNLLKEEFAKNKRFEVISLPKNFGPAYARNRGSEKAKGEYLAFLDSDTVPDKNWLAPLVEAMEKDTSVGACQCKLLLYKERNKFDYAGDYLSQLGFLVQRVKGGEEDRGQADERVEILSAKSAGMIIRADAFKEIGGFDEDYFIYVEETDLGWRTWLAGLRIIFVPESRVYHEFGTTSFIDPKLQNFNAKFHGTKNYITTNFKNLGAKNLIKILPLHIVVWLGIGFWLLIKGQPRYSLYVFLGILWPLLNLKKLIAKRMTVQRKRRKTDEELFPAIFRRTSFKYFYDKITEVHEVGHAKSFYYEK